jgi:hypothetical protein
MPLASLVRKEAVDAEVFHAELDVVGTRELAEMLHVSRQRVVQLRAEGKLPEPDADLAATPVWKRSTVQGFLWGWRRQPGPLPNVVDVDIDRLVSGQ